MSQRRSVRRSLCVLTAAVIALSACSGDDDATTATTVAGESETTDAPTTDASTPTDAPTTTEAPTLDGEGLELGVLAPGPGLLATLFQGQTRGIDAAAQDIADGGGVLGGLLNVVATPAPLGGSETDVVQTALDAGAQVLVGPAGSNVAAEVRDEVQSAGSIICSASATVPGLAAEQEQFGLFRTALPDDVVVSYLADTIIARRDDQAPDAAWNVAIVARSDDYGQSIGNALAASLESRGLNPSVIGYNPQRVLFVGLGSQVSSTQADLTVIVSYEEGSAIVSELVRSGVDPASMIGLDSFFRPRIATIAGPDGDGTAVDGFTMIGTTGNRAFLQRLFTADDNGQVANAAQAYDCAMVLALATEAVANGSSATISDAVRDVTAGGVTCTTYADCLDKLLAGDDIDFDGASGKLAIDELGDPTYGRFTTATIEGGELSIVGTADVDIAELRREQAAFAAASFTTKLQQALAFLGFYDGPIDGLESPELTAALAAFQDSVGLPPTGIYDAATDAALRSALGEFDDLLTSSTVDLQKLLAELGYYDGPIDGIWSTDVTAAVKALQRDLGVPETGVLDAATVRAIYQLGLDAGTPPPTTEPPTTEPPTTEPPTTEPPTTEPPTPELPLTSLLDTLQDDPDFSTFVELALLSGFGDELDQAKQYTVFVPTNEAFDQLSEAELDELRSNPEALREALGYHVVEDRYPVALLGDEILSINGALLEIVRDGEDVLVQDALISKPDIFATNGVIHGIDDFLTPPEIPPS